MMKKLLVSAVLLMMTIGSSVGFPSDFIPLREYYKIHPEQAEKTESFRVRVQNPGIRIKPGVQKKPVRIVFIYPGNQISDYWRRSIKSFTLRMDEIGVRYEISEYFTKVTELRVQERQLQAAFSQAPDYLVYTLNVMKHKKLIERFLMRGRPKLILQNITTPLRDWEGKQPFLYVGFDHAEGTIGYLAEHLIRRTGGRGKYAMLYHTRGYVSAMRGDTLVHYLKENSDLQPAASYYTDGEREKSKQAALEIIRTHDVRFIYACATDTAFGAIDALLETGKSGQILINGWGGGSRELEAVMRGEMDFTVMRINDDNGVAMAEAVRLDIENRTDRVPTVYSGEFVFIEKGIDPDELAEWKARAFRYSNL